MKNADVLKNDNLIVRCKDCKYCIVHHYDYEIKGVIYFCGAMPDNNSGYAMHEPDDSCCLGTDGVHHNTYTFTEDK